MNENQVLIRHNRWLIALTVIIILLTFWILVLTAMTYQEAKKSSESMERTALATERMADVLETERGISFIWILLIFIIIIMIVSIISIVKTKK